MKFASPYCARNFAALKIIVAITGASGAIYTQRLLDNLPPAPPIFELIHPMTTSARGMNCAASLKAQAIARSRLLMRHLRCVCCIGSRAIW